MTPMAANAAGPVWAWGENTFGQLGSGTTTNSDVPVAVSSLTGAIAVAGGEDHSLALESGGTVWAWGDNGYGQLGNNSTTDSSLPVQVEDPTGTSYLTRITAIAAGYNHSLALKSDGTVWAWGLNTYGQLGNNSTINSHIPVQVAGLTEITVIAGGGDHSLALRSDGTVWAWGDNGYGQLGNNNSVNSSVPVQVKDSTAESYLSGVVSVSGGEYHSLAVKDDGTVWAWGDGYYGQLGNGGTADREVPVQVSDLTGITAAAGGGDHSLALRNDGTVWAWGFNAYGQLSGTGESSLVPREVLDSAGTSYLTGITAIAAGYNHSLAVTTGGTVLAWGYNEYGQLGNGATSSLNDYPVQVSGLAGVAEVSGGSWHSLAVTGAIVPSVTLTSSLDPANQGQPITFTAAVFAAATATPTGTVTFLDGTTALGLETLVNGTAAFSTSSLSGGSHSITASYSGDANFAAATSAIVTELVYAGVGRSGALFAWGLNQAGQLGDNSTVNSTVPVSVIGLTGVTGVSGGLSHSLAVRADGTAWAWGLNVDGELGNNSTTSSSVPVPVSNLTGVTQVSGGGWHSLALTSGGTVWAWGDNQYGQLGNNSETNSSVPVQVKDATAASYLTGVVGIAAGNFHSLALLSDGTVWGWGNNIYGQLGNDTDLNSELVPVQVSGLTSVIAVAAGYYHSLALEADGTVWAWGDNSDGQLGSDSTAESSVPVQVSGLAGIIAIAGGAYHNLALRNDGTVWAWGNNTYGQLGYSVFSARVSVPVQVQDPTGTTYLSRVLAIAAGYYHSLALKSDGTVWTWGDNTYGELGNNSLSTSALPVQVSGLAGVISLGAGYDHSMAVVSVLAPSIALTSSPNPATPGQTITFTATVSPVAPATGTPTGTVFFLDGTTTLAIRTLVNGAATFSTAALSNGAHTITAFYSGNSMFGSAQATLTQVVGVAWLPRDVSVGADDLSRVLWANPDGRAVLWSLDRTTGNYTQGPIFGPYDGGAWHATRIACGKDGISHVLWTNPDGRLSLWWLNADNTFQNNVIYGPFAGWVATDIAVGSDNFARILWTNSNDGRAVVWSVNASGAASNNTSFYGPYPGYTAVALACGSDGLTRLIWANPLGIASYWIMNSENQEQSFTIFGPYTDWIPTDIDVGSDNLARVLWTNTVDGRAIVWSVDSSGNATDNTNFYGPYPGYTAQHVACGSDGYTRLMWLSAGDMLSFWHMSADNLMLTFNIYGPYF